LFCAKCLGAQHVLLTDLPDNLALLERNAHANGYNYCTTSRTNPMEDTEKVSILPLDWTEAAPTNDPKRLLSFGNHHTIDIILGSDVFLPFTPKQLLCDLCQTLARLLRLDHDDDDDAYNDKHSKITDSNPQPQQEQSPAATKVALICYEERFDCSAFFQQARNLNLIVEHVPKEFLHPKFQDPGRIHLLRITAGTGPNI
jgi:hypothetical protein